MKRLFLLGDSTCAEKESTAYPETGWGEAFSKFIKTDWTLYNRAQNGRSTRSAILEGIFSNVLLSVDKGDAVIIEFGHNDSKPDVERHSEPWTGYIANLVYMATSLKEKGAIVYFVTSIARRRFVDGIIIDTHGDYPAAMKAAAYQVGVTCIDMTIPTMVELQRLGEEKSLELFMNFKGGIYPNYPNGKEDNTHLRPSGAELIATLLAKKMAELDEVPPFLNLEKQEKESVENISLSDEVVIS